MQTKKKYIGIGILIGIILNGLFTIPLILSQSGNTFIISEGIYPAIPDYTIWQEGSTYYAKSAYGVTTSGTNASQIIQNAMDTLSDIGGAPAFADQGGTIFFKRGEYNLTATLVSPASINLIGSGEDVTSLVGMGVNVLNITDYNPSPYTDNWGPLIRDMTIRCRTSAKNGITIDASNRVIWYTRIDKVRFVSVDTAINVIGRAYHTKISNARISAPLNYGIRTIGSGGNYPNGIEITHCDISMQNDTVGIYLYASHAVISENWFEYSAPWGGTFVIIAGGGTNSLTNNYFGYQPWGFTQVEIRDNAEKAMITANRFDGAANTSIFINSSARGNHRITSNIFHDFTNYGIYVESGVENIGIVGNSFEARTTNDGIIYFEGESKGTIIDANSFNYTGTALTIYAINGGSIISDNYLYQVGAIGIYYDYTLVIGNSVINSGAWGIQEVGSADYNVITSDITSGCTTGGIRVLGANTNVNLSWNNTVWVP